MVFDQAENALHSQKALLLTLMAGRARAAECALSDMAYSWTQHYDAAFPESLLPYPSKTLVDYARENATIGRTLLPSSQRTSFQTLISFDERPVCGRSRQQPVFSGAIGSRGAAELSAICHCQSSVRGRPARRCALESLYTEAERSTRSGRPGSRSSSHHAVLQAAEGIQHQTL